MCEKCRLAVEAALRPTAAVLRESDNVGAALVGELLEARIRFLDGQRSEQETRDAVTELCADAFVHSRRYAVAICTDLIMNLTGIKQRLIEEQIEQADPNTIAVRYDADARTFVVRVGSADGPVIVGTSKQRDDETPAQGARRTLIEFQHHVTDVHEG